MSKNQNGPGRRPMASLQTILADDALPAFRRAYHQLEAFQLSSEHQRLKEQLKLQLAQPDLPPPAR